MTFLTCTDEEHTTTNSIIFPLYHHHNRGHFSPCTVHPIYMITLKAVTGALNFLGGNNLGNLSSVCIHNIFLAPTLT